MNGAWRAAESTRKPMQASGVRFEAQWREQDHLAQEDHLQQTPAGAAWGLTVFRRTVIYGDAMGNNMNPIPAIAAYAAILRERRGLD